MKRIRMILVLTLCTFLLAGTMSAFAYDHCVSVSTGNGTFEEGGDYAKGGTSATIDTSTGKVTVGGSTYTVVPPEDKYFIMGLKRAGYDNKDNTAIFPTGVDVSDSSSLLYDQDAELVVAYGLQSNMVEYTVRYVSANTGETLMPSDTYYGVDGSQPVVTYKYLEDYLPDRYNVTGTIHKGVTNEFIFYYYEYQNGVINTVIADGIAVAGGGAAGGAGAAGAAAANIGDAAVPLADGQPQQVVNIDDPNTPLADGDDANIDDNKTPGANWPAIGGGAALVALIAAIAIFLAKRKKEQSEEE